LLLDPEVIRNFSDLDDHDIYSAFKEWARHDEPVLSRLCKMLLNRELFGTELQAEEFDEARVDKLRNAIAKKYAISEDEANYFLISNTTENHAYHPKSDKINIHFKTGEILDIASASEQLNITVSHKTVVKHFLCYPKEFRECL
jgi:hypothetical protein